MNEPITVSDRVEVDAIRLRVLVTKIGLDGHDRGSRLVAAFLRDAGHEVVYTPPWQQITDVVNLALQEDVDVVGISSLATDHLIVPDLMAALREAGLEHVAVIVGGIVPEPEAPALIEAGVREIFGPGSSREQIVDSVAAWGEEARRHKLAQGGFDT
jgi:methylmalonyl-CoA mutase C-terminal domain/subunit